MTDQELWADFNPDTERVYSGSDNVKHRVQVPARVVALRTIEPTDEEMEKCDPFGTRQKLALEYASEGDVIDTQIDVWGWGAANTYDSRRGYGYETMPDAINRHWIHTPPEEV